MTDPHDLDELASAHLDGATSPAEAALVAADPALQARVEELRVIRAAVREVPAVDAARRDAAIAAALEVFDDEAADDRPSAPVTPITPRRGLSPTAVRVLGAAAVFVLLALLVPLLSHLGGGDDEASFQATGDAIEGSEPSSDGADAASGAAGSSDATTPVLAPEAQSVPPAYPDLDALAEAVAGRDLPQRSFDTERGATVEVDAGCKAALTPQDGTEVGSAVVAGKDVIVWVRQASDGTRELKVFSADTCGLLDQREL